MGSLTGGVAVFLLSRDVTDDACLLSLHEDSFNAQYFASSLQHPSAWIARLQSNGSEILGKSK